MAEVTTKVVWFPTGWPSQFKPNDPSKPHCKSLPHTRSLKKHWPTMVLLHSGYSLLLVSSFLTPFQGAQSHSKLHMLTLLDALVLLCQHLPVFSFRCITVTCTSVIELLWIFWLFERQNVSLKCFYSFICVRKQNLSGGLQAQIEKMQQQNLLVCQIRGLALETFFFISMLWLEKAVWPHALRMLLKFKNSWVNDNF